MKKDKNPRSIRAEMNTRFKKSALAMCVIALSSPSFAQDTDTEEQIDEIIVSGVRQNLQNAQDIKRNADTFVDSISAADIGSLPDRSVLEAMQRIPGVSIERFAAANDPDHFGVEGSGAVVRGMSQTRSEFNGRDSFTANSGRGLSFQDVPPELMGGVDIYKNQTADMIEGGIAGTVSLRTRLPFDQADRQIAFSADVTYGDMVEEATPTLSALFSDTWDTSAGRFGFLINLSDSNLEASSHGIQTDRMEFRALEGPGVRDQGVLDPGFPYVTTPYIYDGTFLDAPPNTALNTPGVLVPNGANLTMKNDVRDRSGIALATQWESLDETLVATAQFMRSDATLAWTENAVKYQTGFNDTSHMTYGGPSEQYKFDDNGVFVSGSLADVSVGWRGDDDRLPHNVANGDWGTSPVNEFGHRFQTDNRYKRTHTVVDDLAFNVVWTPSDNLELTADLQHIRAETEDDDVTLMYLTHAVMDYDLRGNGDTPQLSVSNPWIFATEENLAAHAADGRDYASGDQYFHLPSSYIYNAAMDHYERSEGESTALRLDGVYSFDDSPITKVLFGVRAAEREQRVNNSAYNWGRLGPIWEESSADQAWLDTAVVAEAGLSDNYQFLDWSDFYRGGILEIEGGNQMIHPSDQLTRDFANWGDMLGAFYNPSDDSTCGDEWRPANQRVKAEWDADAGACVPENLNGYFLDNEINLTIEKNQAAYVRLDFEHEIGSSLVNGNFGVRYVRITNETEGFTVYPQIVRNENLPADWDPNNVDPADYDLFTPGSSLNFLGQESNFIDDIYLDFANNAYTPNVADRTYDDILPSFNLKVGFTDELIGRFAVSKAIALPDLGDLRNYTSISSLGFNRSFRAPYWGPQNPHPDTPLIEDPETGEMVQDPSGLPVVIDPETGEPVTQQQIVDPNTISFNGWTGTSGNPNLLPMESIQFDASLEWYFDNAGSLTASIFYKDLKNFFINGAFDREFTNPVSGVTQTVRVAGPTNGGEGKMQGFEIAYQQFFDMLPAPWDGFGVQTNYSYIEARGVPNTNLQADSSTGVDSDSFAFGDSLPLEGQSDHTANFVAMYEKNDLSVRLAYNWRSEYLLTARDVITGLPIYNDEAGFMDGSIFYNINDNITIGLQGVNLLNTQTRTYMQVDEELQLGRSWFVNDRRYTFVVRATF